MLSRTRFAPAKIRSSGQDSSLILEGRARSWSKMTNDVYLFIPVDDGRQRREGAKPESQKYAVLARKHVMRDIGFQRRKPKTNAQEKSSITITGQEDACLTAKCLNQRQMVLVGDARSQNDDVEWRQNRSALNRLALDIRDGCYLPALSRGLGSGRLSPFVHYPVPLDHRSRFLLDTRKYIYH